MMFGSPRMWALRMRHAEADSGFIGMDRRDPTISRGRFWSLIGRFEEANTVGEAESLSSREPFFDVGEPCPRETASNDPLHRFATICRKSGP